MEKKKKVDNGNELFENIKRYYHEIRNLLSNLDKNYEIQNIMYLSLYQYLYCNIIRSFFNNLNQSWVNKNNIYTMNITKCKKSLRAFKAGCSKSYYFNFVQDSFPTHRYSEFKKAIKVNFPEYIQLLSEIEYGLEFNRVRNFIYKVKSKVFSLGRDPVEFTNSWLKTRVILIYLKEKKRFPNVNELNKITKIFINKSLPQIAVEMYSSLDEEEENYYKDKQKRDEDFQKVIDKKYTKLIKKYSYFISLNEEVGQNVLNSIKNGDVPETDKANALIQIHAKSILIAREIECLSKNGFSDGAMARYRSIYELSIVAQFLADSKDEVSTSYLGHSLMKKYHDYKTYVKSYKKLKFPSVDKNEAARLRRRVRKMIAKYGDKFNYKNGYEWASYWYPNINTLRDIESYVGSSHLRPFYKLSSNIIHPGSSSFVRLGLNLDPNPSVLLSGKSNAGMEDPVQNATIQLNIITHCLLVINHDLNSILYARTLQIFVDKILSEIGVLIKKKK